MHTLALSNMLIRVLCIVWWIQLVSVQAVPTQTHQSNTIDERLIQAGVAGLTGLAALFVGDQIGQRRTRATAQRRIDAAKDDAQKKIEETDQIRRNQVKSVREVYDEIIAKTSRERYDEGVRTGKSTENARLLELAWRLYHCYQDLVSVPGLLEQIT